MFRLFTPFRLFRPRRPSQHVLGSLVGVVLLGGMLVFGAIALLAIAVIGGVVWLVRQMRSPALTASAGHAAPPPAPAGVIEGEFVVLRDGARVTSA
jgi:hypothetical protein